MSAVYLNSISENASRLGMRLQESFSEHTRDLTIARGSSSLYLEDDKYKNIQKQLDSSSDREKLDAMKRLVAVRHDFYLESVSLTDWPTSSSPKAATFPNTLRM